MVLSISDSDQPFDIIDSCFNHILEHFCPIDQLEHCKEEHRFSSNVEEYKDYFLWKAHMFSVDRKSLTSHMS